MRRFALLEEHMTLEALLSKAKALENSEKQAQGIENWCFWRKIYQQCRNCGLTLVFLFIYLFKLFVVVIMLTVKDQRKIKHGRQPDNQIERRSKKLNESNPKTKPFLRSLVLARMNT